MRKLTKAQIAALIEAGDHYVKTWPNEECIPQLQSGLAKLREAEPLGELHQQRRNAKRRRREAHP